MITWKEYYEHFYDLKEREQVRKLYDLSSLGPVEEVAEIIHSLGYNKGASDRLLKKAVEAKLSFCLDDLLSFSFNNKHLVSEAALNSINSLACEDMVELYGLIEEDVFVKMCRLKGIELTYIKGPEDTTESSYEDYDDYDEPEEKSGGFFLGVVGLLFRFKSWI